MRKDRLIASFTIILFLSGCSVAAPEIFSSSPQADPSPTTSTQPYSSYVEQADEVAYEEVGGSEFNLWTATASPEPAEFCKVPDQRPSEFRGLSRGHKVEGIPYGGPSGFPLVQVTVPNRGQVDWLFLMVAFKDSPKFVDSPKEFLDPQIAKLEEWDDFWSQGKLDFNISYVDYWIDLPMNTLEMPQSDKVITDIILEQLPDGMRYEDFDATFIQWADLAKSPNFLRDLPESKVDFGVRLGSNEHADSDGSGAFVWAPSIYHSSNEGQPLEHKREFTYGHWLHEILHEMGLNLHAPGNGWPTGVGQNTYPLQQGGMYFSGAISAWEQFLITWLDDSQVHCVDRNDVSSTRAILTPLETYGGSRKMIAIPNINKNNEILVVEARKPSSWTAWNARDVGLFVYRVDPTAKHRDHVPGDCGNDPSIEKWAYYLYPEGSELSGNGCGYFGEALLKEGGTVSYEGITIKLEAIVDGLFYTEVQIQG